MSRAATAYDRIYAVVRRVPNGKVTTYGAVARIAGLPGRARQVGYALAALRDGTSVPWHRVVNAQGKLSLARAGSPSGITQRLRLTREGVRVDAGDRVSLARYGWKLESGSSRADRGKQVRRSASRS
ncbi:MAG TPA: MGMT family protein [Gemmatimonadaceae bacterium]|nr:MGMT family protein [Gemmatimonadaceae bacterium]